MHACVYSVPICIYNYIYIYYLLILIQVAREYSGVSSLGASALELPRTADDKSMDSHHTTGLTATLSGSLALSMFQSVHNYVHNYTCRCHSIIIMLHTTLLCRCVQLCFYTLPL